MTPIKKEGEGFATIDHAISCLRKSLLASYSDAPYDETSHDKIHRDISSWRDNLPYRNVTIVFGVSSKNTADKVRFVNVSIRYIVPTNDGDRDAHRSFRLHLLNEVEE